MAVVLMGMAKKEATEAVPRFKASKAFVDEIKEVVIDSFFKGLENCRKKVA